MKSLTFSLLIFLSTCSIYTSAHGDHHDHHHHHHHEDRFLINADGTQVKTKNKGKVHNCQHDAIEDLLKDMKAEYATKQLNAIAAETDDTDVQTTLRRRMSDLDTRRSLNSYHNLRVAYDLTRLGDNTDDLIAGADTHQSREHTCYEGGPAKVPNSYRATTASSDFTCTAGNKFTDEKRTFLKTVLLPQSKELLSNALTVSDADQAPGAESSMTPFAQCFNSPSTSLPGECTWDAIDNTKTFKDADFVLYIIARPTDTGVIAWATTLVRDPVTRRPLVGVANFNPEHLTQPKCPDLTNCLYDEDCSGSGKCSGNFHSQLGTAIHEIVHALGFSSSSWGQFKDLDEDKVIDRKTKLDGTTRTFVITPNVSKIKIATQ